jgi:hypothetical protein
MYWLVIWLESGEARIVYAAEAPDYGDAVDPYDTERDAMASLREWREERE